MANQACISIGINQYQFLQPLGYGVEDAVAMESFFVDAAGWDRSQCLLLSDTSPQVNDRSTYPDRDNITKWLKQWCWDSLKAGDLLWFFFSGYGVSTEDDDYLVPIDGNPADPANTCISLREVYKELHEAGANISIFLDVNRSQNTQGGGVGKVAAKLAQQYQIPTFLSCQTQEFSHETAELSHGLFTTALLEALNYHHDLNIETLESYLTSRLAELSEHHWKPLQTPVAIVPAGVSVYRPIFSATTQTAVSRSVDPPFSPPTPPPFQPKIATVPFVPLAPLSESLPPPAPLDVQPPIGGAIVPIDADENSPPRGSIWKKIGAIVAILIGAGGGLYLYQSQQPTVAPPPMAIVEPEKPSETPPPANIPGLSLADARAFVKPGDATSRYQAILVAQKIRADDPAAQEAKRLIEQWAKEIYEIAQIHADKQKWAIAIATAKMVPPQASNYNTAQSAMSEWKSKL